jgi:hypothetical protein
MTDTPLKAACVIGNPGADLAVGASRYRESYVPY